MMQNTAEPAADVADDSSGGFISFDVIDLTLLGDEVMANEHDEENTSFSSSSSSSSSSSESDAGDDGEKTKPLSKVSAHPTASSNVVSMADLLGGGGVEEGADDATHEGNGGDATDAESLRFLQSHLDKIFEAAARVMFKNADALLSRYGLGDEGGGSNADDPNNIIVASVTVDNFSQSGCGVDDESNALEKKDATPQNALTKDNKSENAQENSRSATRQVKSQGSMFGPSKSSSKGRRRHKSALASDEDGQGGGGVRRIGESLDPNHRIAPSCLSMTPSERKRFANTFDSSADDEGEDDDEDEDGEEDAGANHNAANAIENNGVGNSEDIGAFLDFSDISDKTQKTEKDGGERSEHVDPYCADAISSEATKRTVSNGTHEEVAIGPIDPDDFSTFSALPAAEAPSPFSAEFACASQAEAFLAAATVSLKRREGESKEALKLREEKAMLDNCAAALVGEVPQREAMDAEEEEEEGREAKAPPAPLHSDNPKSFLNAVKEHDDVRPRGEANDSRLIALLRGEGEGEGGGASEGDDGSHGRNVSRVLSACEERFPSHVSDGTREGCRDALAAIMAQYQR